MIYYRGNTLHICVDQMGAGVVKGRAYLVTRKSPILFTDFGELFLQADQQFDRQGFPQSFQDKRSFQLKKKQDNLFRAKPDVLLPSAEFEDERGALYTLIIQVESRQNASWQGVIRAMDGSLIAAFDSEMHLLDRLQALKQE